MANEKPAAAPAAPAAGAEKEAPKKKGGLKMIITAVVVVVLEVGTVGVTMKLSSGPKPTMAESVTTTTAPAPKKDVEVKVIEASLPNNKTGKLWRYDFAVVAKVSEENKEKVTDLFKERDGEIRDQIRTIVAASLPEALAEPGLETIRRQIQYQLEEDIGKDLIKEVLIPKCNPSPIQY